MISLTFLPCMIFTMKVGIIRKFSNTFFDMKITIITKFFYEDFLKKSIFELFPKSFGFALNSLVPVLKFCLEEYESCGNLFFQFPNPNTVNNKTL